MNKKHNIVLLFVFDALEHQLLILLKVFSIFKLLLDTEVLQYAV